MAYVLGFFVADGSMIKNKRGAHFIEFEIIDGILLNKIRSLLGSNHKITTRKRNIKWSNSYRLQIGSKEMFSDLLKIGVLPAKSKIIDLPLVPDKYFSHFVRGYFDGDGTVWAGLMHKNDRKKSTYVLLSGFISGSEKFINSFRHKLKIIGGLKGGSLQYHDRAYRLHYSGNDSIKLYKFMYRKNSGLHLQRKKLVFDRFFER